MTQLVNLEKIAIDVTSEQIGKCSKVIDLQTNEDFYMCESSDGSTDYKTCYDPEKGFTCTCEAGKRGFVNCKNYCWHVRASVAAFLEEEAAMQELQEKIAEQKAHTLALPAVKLSRTEASMPAWIMNARPSKGMDKAPREI